MNSLLRRVEEPPPSLGRVTTHWRSRDAFVAMLRNSDARPHITRAAALASFDPMLCEVAHVDHA